MRRRYLPAVLPLVLCVLPSNVFAQKCVAPSFVTAAPTFAIGAAPDDIVSADFDNDGLPDVAVGDTGRVQVLLGTAGGFTLSATILAAGTTAVAVGDINKDGNVDVAIAAAASLSIFTALGNGAGGFGVPTPFNVSPGSPGAIELVDVDHDGNLDIIYGDGLAPGISVLLGDGLGGFAVGPAFTMGYSSEMAIGDLDNDGNVDVVITNTAANQIDVALGLGTGVFVSGGSYGTGDSPFGLTVADFTQDGKLDVVTMDMVAMTVTVLQGIGDGTFVPLAPVPSPDPLVAFVAAGDFDGDGNLDLLGPNLSSKTVSIYLGNGLGAFTTGDVVLAPSDAHNLVVADFDRDGRDDFVTTLKVAGTIALYLNDYGIPCSLPSFDRLGYNIPTSTAPVAIATGDFDRDHFVDIATADQGSNTVTVRLRSGVNFALPTPFPTGTAPVSIAAADFTSDGFLDLVTANQGTMNISILTNDSTGDFGTRTDFALGAVPVELAAEDVNFDGKFDIIVTRTDGKVSVAFGDGTGGLGTFADYTVGASPGSLVIGDFDNDGPLDLAVTKTTPDEVVLFKNQGNGTYAAVGSVPITGVLTGVRAAFFDGNQNLDLVVSYRLGGAGRVQTLLGDGALGFSAGSVTPIFGAPMSGHGLTTSDFDGNGTADVAVANADLAAVTVLLGNGSGGLPTVRQPSLGVAPSAVATDDMDRDATPDLLATELSTDVVSLLLNDGTARFAPDFFPSSDTDNRGVATGDLDHDGILDLVIANAKKHSFAVYRGTGGGQFSAPVDHDLGFGALKPVWITLADFTADGHLDVVTTNEGSSSLSFFEGDGTGGFAPPLPSIVFGFIPSVTRAVDLDADGMLDLAVVVDNTVEILQGDNAGNFSNITAISLGGTGSGLELGDFDHDGDIDIAATQVTDDALEIYWAGPAPFSWSPGPQIILSADPLIFAAADLNNDGNIDFIVPEDASNQVTVILATGSGTWTLGSSYPTPGAPIMARAMDINADGFTDFVVSIRSGHTLGLFTGDGAGNFLRDFRTAGLAQPVWMTTGDFDANGREDIAVVPDTIAAGSPPGGVAVVLNTNCLPRRLVSITEPSTCDLPDTPFVIQPELSVTDDGWNVVQCELSPILASIVPGTGTPGAVLSGTNPEVPFAGVVSYTDLEIDRRGGGYQLEFVHPTAPHRLLSDTFSQALAAAIVGPLEVCQGDPAIFSANPGYDMYNWLLDAVPQTMAPVADLTAALSPGLHTVDLSVEQDTCMANDDMLFNVTPPLGLVTISPTGPESVCEICAGGQATSVLTGGGVVSYEWGYRAVSMGPTTAIPLAVGPEYTIDSNDFPGTGTYYLVLTVTPACGAPVTSNEIQVDVTTATVANPLVAFTARSTSGENFLEWATPPTGSCIDVRIIRRENSTFPTDPLDLAPPNMLVGDFACPAGKDSTSDSGLTDTTTYNYAAWVYDGTGYSTSLEVTGRPFDHTVGPVKWAYTTGASSLAPPGLRPVGTVGTVYVVSNDNLIHSVDANGYWPATWKPFRMSAPAQSRPPVPRFPLGTGGAAGANGAVLLGSQDGNIYVIDADEGDIVWKQNVGAMVQAAPAGIFPEFGGGKDLILIGTRNGVPNRFRAYDVDSGTAAWSFQNMPIHGGDGSSIGIISGGASVDYAAERVFFASHKTGNSSLWSVDFSTGSAMLEWALDLGDIETSPIYLPGSPAQLIVANTLGDVHLLDPDAGGAPVWLAPFNAGDGAVKGFVFPQFGTPNYMISTLGNVTSFENNGPGTTPTLYWQVPVANASIPLFVVGTDTALVGSNNGELVQINGVDTISPWTTSVTLGDGTGIVGAPTLHGGAASRIYVGTDRGVIYAVSWPLP